MNVRFVGIAVLVFAAACTPAPEPVAASTDAAAATPSSPYDAPNELFEAVEPTIFGITAAPTVWDVLAPVGRRSPEGPEGRQRTDLRVRNEAGGAVADLVQSGLLDDAVESEHLRLELRLEPEGWFVTNAYVRQICRRGEDAGKWTKAPCP
jgi:hypothetical protein